jgi:hypothetical protein
MSLLSAWRVSADHQISLPRRIVRTARRWWRERIQERSWRREGCPLPAPAHIKRRWVREHALRHGARIFVETGTLYGDTLAAVRDIFDELHSVELDDALYERASERFADDSQIKLWHGDSGSVLTDVLPAVNNPAVFWLDGHYSGPGTAKGTLDSPIRLELDAIGRHLRRASHLVLIDDARLFDGTNCYPTLDELRAYATTLGFIHMRTERDLILLSAAPLQ